MSIPITPQRAVAMYECLCKFPPFSRWRLPPGGKIEFRVLHTRRYDAAYQSYCHTRELHGIDVSSARNGHFGTLAMSMAHEMIHLRQRIANTETPNTEHNAEFRRIAERVCRRFGFDPKQFI